MRFSQQRSRQRERKCYVNSVENEALPQYARPEEYRGLIEKGS